MRQLILVVFFFACIGCNRDEQPDSLFDRVSADEISSVSLPVELLDAMDSYRTVELFTIFPDDGFHTEDGNFHGFRVLGSKEIEALDAKILFKAFKIGVLRSDRASSCFWPRHALRLNCADKTVDILICFQCNQTKIFVDDEKIAEPSITSGPKPFFDSKVQKFGLPVPPAAKQQSND